MPRNGGPSLNLQVILFFARNPEEFLNTDDLTLKFGIPPNAVHKRLRQSVVDRMLHCKSQGPGRGRTSVWSAGEVLLSMIGGRPVVITSPVLVAANMPVVVRAA